jgi:hypothetical protein
LVASASPVVSVVAEDQYRTPMDPASTDIKTLASCLNISVTRTLGMHLRKRLRVAVKAEAAAKKQGEDIRWTIFRNFAAQRGHVDAVVKWLQLAVKVATSSSSFTITPPPPNNDKDCVGCRETTVAFLMPSLERWLNRDLIPLIAQYTGQLEDPWKYPVWQNCKFGRDGQPAQYVFYLAKPSWEPPLSRVADLRCLPPEHYRHDPDRFKIAWLAVRDVFIFFLLI